MEASPLESIVVCGSIESNSRFSREAENCSTASGSELDELKLELTGTLSASAKQKQLHLAPPQRSRQEKAKTGLSVWENRHGERTHDAS